MLVVAAESNHRTIYSLGLLIFPVITGQKGRYCNTEQILALITTKIENRKSNCHFKHPLTASKIRKKTNFHCSKAYLLKICKVSILRCKYSLCATVIIKKCYSHSFKFEEVFLKDRWYIANFNNKLWIFC